MTTKTETDADFEWFEQYLAEGIHTAFRKGSDDPGASAIHRLIQGLPGNDWNNITDVIASGVWAGMRARGMLVNKYQPAETPSVFGVVAVLISPRGAITATATDFDTSGYGGYTQLDAQKLRVRRKLADAMIAAYCAPDFGQLFTDYTAASLLDKALLKGFKVEYIPVGHDRTPAD